MLTADTKHPQHAVVAQRGECRAVGREAQVGDAASRRPVHVEEREGVSLDRKAIDPQDLRIGWRVAGRLAHDDVATGDRDGEVGILG